MKLCKTLFVLFLCGILTCQMTIPVPTTPDSEIVPHGHHPDNPRN